MFHNCLTWDELVSNFYFINAHQIKLCAYQGVTVYYHSKVLRCIVFQWALMFQLLYCILKNYTLCCKLAIKENCFLNKPLCYEKLFSKLTSYTLCSNLAIREKLAMKLKSPSNLPYLYGGLKHGTFSKFNSFMIETPII